MSSGTPYPMTPDDWLARLRELREEAGDHVAGQHVVSVVVSKRFTDPTGQLRLVSVRYQTARSVLRGPSGFGKIRDFIPVASASAEKLWKEVEDRLPAALELCDHDRIHDDEAALDLIRDAIALHFTRSPQFWIVHARVYLQARASAEAAARSHPGFKSQFYKKYGLHPAGPEAEEIILRDLFAEHDNAFADGVTLRESIERVFAKTRVWLSEHPLEIIHPEDGEFIIGDTPALTVSTDGRIGPANGVALGDATQIIMPIGPRTLLAVGPANAVGRASHEVVDQLNALQVAAASDYVAMHPDANLESFVRTTRFG